MQPLSSPQRTYLTSEQLRRTLGYKKFRRRERLRVLLLDGRYHLHEEASRALRLLGHSVRCVRADYPSAAENLSSLLQGLIEHKPDFIFLINHIGLDAEGRMGALLEEIGMPIACWYCDSPLFVLRTGKLPAPSLSTLFVWEKSFINILRSRGAEDVHHLPLACDEKSFFQADIATSNFLYPVSFVGDSIKRSLDIWRKRIHQKDQPTVDLLRNELLSNRINPWDSNPDILKTALRSSIWDVLAVATFEATQKYRKDILKQANFEELHIVGDDGWKTQIPKAHLHPVIRYGEELVSLYRGSAVNLNATSLQMTSAVNQRVFDIPMAGGFVLSDAQDDLFSLFDPGKEIAYYSSRDDVTSKLDFYLKNPSLREAITAHARDRIKKEHTYRKRVAFVCEKLFQRHHNGLAWHQNRPASQNKTIESAF